MPTPPVTLYETHLKGLPLKHRGKVRDIYDAGPDHLLIVTTDRLSAFDVVLPDPIPGKGMVLDGISRFWFEKTTGIIPNQLTELGPADVLPDRQEQDLVNGRAMVVQKLKALPVEAVVRGYLIGSGWKDYCSLGTVCGIPLPAGLQQAEKLSAPIFTPATKAAVGEHDENIDFTTVENLVGAELAAAIRHTSIELYQYAAEHARQRGIIIADTKFEFGLDKDGRLILIDEVLTPDSSRFWPADSYRTGISPPSFDKQFVRDYLETLDWNKKAPGPHLPDDIVKRTADKYQEAYRRLTAS